MPLTTETSFQPIGPAYLFVGDPTQASGAGMRQLGLIRNVQFNPQIRQAFTSADAQSGVPHADGLYYLASMAEVTAEMQSLTYAEIQALVFGATTTSSGTNATIGAPDQFGAVAGSAVPTLCILPSQESAQGVAAQHAIWLPAVTIQISNLSFQRVEEGEITNAHQVSFRAAYRSTDQASATIPIGNRIWFIGRPSVLGLNWSLPAIT